MNCFFVKKTKKTDLVFQYSTDDDRIEIRSSKNRGRLKAIVKKYFKQRKLKEFESEKDTLDILALRIDSSEYPLFVNDLMLELKSRISHINSSIDIMDLSSEDATDELDSLQELIAIQTFIRRYFDLIEDKKYKDYTYYIIESNEL